MVKIEEPIVTAWLIYSTCTCIVNMEMVPYLSDSSIFNRNMQITVGL